MTCVDEDCVRFRQVVRKMSPVEHDSPSPERFPKTARLLPLPSLVLFPRVVQPLRICEPRDRELLEAALADDRLIATALLAPGWEHDYEGRPRLLPVACLGRIAAHHCLDDGSSNVLVAGLRRVRLLRELPPTKGFREAEVELLEDVCFPADAARERAFQRRLRDALARVLPDLPAAGDSLHQLLHGDVSLGALTDIISHLLDIELEAKHALLAEANVHRRAESLLGHLSAVASDTALGRAGRSEFPPEFGLN